MNLGDQLTQYLFSGFATGAIYALIGLGFAIIYNTTGIINFAQGEFVMLGGMLSLFLMKTLHLPLPLALPGAVLLTTVIGVFFERLAIRPLRSPTPLSLVIITIGGSILIRGLTMLLAGKDTHALPGFSGSDPIELAGATILPQHLWIFGITILVIIASKLFFNYSISGKAMRACAFNSRAASLIGVDV